MKLCRVSFLRKDFLTEALNAVVIAWQKLGTLQVLPIVCIQTGQDFLKDEIKQSNAQLET